jgi:antitoxin (DNA-binding transcriptional repressor) of toxin-antitoxin stability system
LTGLNVNVNNHLREALGMKTLSVSQFRTTCLAVLDQVYKQKKGVLITKPGKPIAKIIPMKGLRQEFPPLKDTVTFLGDILSPVRAKEWEAGQ